MKTKTRGMWIRRIHNVVSVDKNGNEKILKEERRFPCRINNAIVPDHRMIEHNAL